jgi:hypothetical protein
MPGSPLQNYFAADPSRLLHEVSRVTRNRGRISNLIEKGLLPEGVGYNYQKLVSTRSAIVSGVTWTDVDTPNGESNNCAPTVTEMNWSSDTNNYKAQQALLRSNIICFADVSKGYLFEQQVANIQKNFVDNIYEAWDDQDKLNYFTNAGHKVLIVNGNILDTQDATDFPAVQSTSQITQSVLDVIYENLIQDGAGEDAYAYSNGAPLLTMLTSMGNSRAIIKQDASVRQDFRFAEEGFGKEATLMKAWGTDKAYAGFMHCIDNRMPRFNWSGGDYVPVPYWQDSSATIGQKSNVNPAYTNAQFEDIYIWHPKVVKRLTPKAPHSAGGMTSFEAVPYSGEIVWRNIENDDITSPAFNPLGNQGRYYAQMVAAYEPNVTQWGYILRVQRCNNLDQSACYGR